MFLSPRPQASQFGRACRLSWFTLSRHVVEFLISEVERTDVHESHRTSSVTTPLLTFGRVRDPLLPQLSTALRRAANSRDIVTPRVFPAIRQ